MCLITLIQHGLKAVKRIKKPRLCARHIKQRLDFAKRYQHYTVDDWKMVFFSDETKINRLCSDGINWIWKNKDSNLPLQPREVQETVKFGGGNIKIWGCMNPGYICQIEGNMNSELYSHILSTDYIDSVNFYNTITTQKVHLNIQDKE